MKAPRRDPVLGRVQAMLRGVPTPGVGALPVLAARPMTAPWTPAAIDPVRGLGPDVATPWGTFPREVPPDACPSCGAPRRSFGVCAACRRAARIVVAWHAAWAWRPPKPKPKDEKHNATPA